MKQHQELLELSQLKPSNETEIITSPTNLIQFSPAIVSKSNGTLIITLQTSTAASETHDANITDTAHGTDLTSTHYEIVEEPHVYGKTASTAQILDECPTRINSISIEREFNELNDITGDSDTECNEDNDENATTTTINHVEQEKFKEFPKLIEDSKLLYVFEFSKFAISSAQNNTNVKYSAEIIFFVYLWFPKRFKGHDLLNMISKFYRLECDQWYVGISNLIFIFWKKIQTKDFLKIVLNICSEGQERPMFECLSDLCQHYVDVHQIKGYVVCCGLKLIKPRAMALHMARHLQPDAFKCPECNKMLTCPKILQHHMQNHLPESQRPLACPQCPRR